MFVTQRGKPRAVLMKHEDYQALQEKLEDLEDALAMQQSLASPEEEAMNLDEYERQRLAHLHR
jgi:PHD/YefM family antitoxin component YafN of YafNO toxin-antitoxin module